MRQEPLGHQFVRLFFKKLSHPFSPLGKTRSNGTDGNLQNPGDIIVGEAQILAQQKSTPFFLRERRKRSPDIQTALQRSLTHGLRGKKKSALFRTDCLVEVAGIEPASERPLNRVSTSVVSVLSR